MTGITRNWKQECASIEELSCITQPGSRPSVAFTDLLIPASLKSAVQTWTVNDFQQKSPRKHSPVGDHFTVDGFYKDPARSVEARAALAGQFRQSFPATEHSDALAELMADRFTRLAAALDRRCLNFIVRSDHRKEDQLHLDRDAEYTSIAYLSNVSTLFANPATLNGKRPREVPFPGAFDDSMFDLIYTMTPEIKAGLEGVPTGSLAVWPGGFCGAAHVTPPYEGSRTIVIADTTRFNQKPALP